MSHSGRMYFNDIVKEGYVKEKSKNLGLLKRRWLVLRKASSRGISRLQVFPDEETSNDGVKMIREYTLANVRSVSKVAPNQTAYGFILSMDATCAQMFVCETGSEAEEWEEVLQNAVQHGDSVSFLEGSTQDMKNVFRACLLTASKLSISGECLLVVGSEQLRLLDSNDPRRQLASWPLVALRRYGSESETFTFESGRACDTGEGLFCLSSVHAEAIHQAVKSATIAFATAFRIGQMDEQQKRMGLTKSLSVPEVSQRTPANHTPVCETKSSPTASMAGRAPMPIPRTFTQNSAVGSSGSSPVAVPPGRRVQPQMPVPETRDTPTFMLPPNEDPPRPPSTSPRQPAPPATTESKNSIDATDDNYQAYLDPAFRKFLNKRLNDTQ